MLTTTMANQQRKDEDSRYAFDLALQEADDFYLAHAIVVSEREEICRQQRRLRPPTPRWRSPPTRCWLEQEDRAVAQSFADLQREEIYWQQRQRRLRPLTPRWRSPPTSCWSEQEDRAVAQSFADLQREEIYWQQRQRRLRPLTPHWRSPPASCWSEQEDRAVAQSLADLQREEVYRQQRKPNYFPAHRQQQQRKKGPTFWSRYGDHLQPTCSSAHSQQQPPIRSCLDSLYWLTCTQQFLPMQHYVEPTYQQPRPKQAESKDRRQQEPEILEIPGVKAVTHQVMNKYINHCEKDCENCRRMMQNVRVLVTNLESEDHKRLENFEVTCYGEHFTLVIWSGKRTNKMVVQTVEGKTHVSVTKESWRIWFKKVANKCWNTLKNAALKILNKVGGAAIGGVIFEAIGM